MRLRLMRVELVAITWVVWVTGLSRAEEVLNDERGFSCPEPPPMALECYWAKKDLSYAYDTYPTDIPKRQYRQAIEAAIRTWEAVTPVVMAEVAATSDPDIVFMWVPKKGGTAEGPATAGGPPGCGITAYPCRPIPVIFKTGLRDIGKPMKWGVLSDPVDPEVYDIETIALHELGHVLGLFHCDDPIEDRCETKHEVMQYRSGPGVKRRKLTQADIRNVQARYVRPKVPE